MVCFLCLCGLLFLSLSVDWFWRVSPQLKSARGLPTATVLFWSCCFHSAVWIVWHHLQRHPSSPSRSVDGRLSERVLELTDVVVASGCDSSSSSRHHFAFDQRPPRHGVRFCCFVLFCFVFTLNDCCFSAFIRRPMSLCLTCVVYSQCNVGFAIAMRCVSCVCVLLCCLHFVIVVCLFVCAFQLHRLQLEELTTLFESVLKLMPGTALRSSHSSQWWQLTFRIE